MFDESPRAHCLLRCLLKREFSFFKNDFDLELCITSFEATPASAPTGTERAAWEADFFTTTETATTMAAELYFSSEEVDEQLLS